MFNTGASLNYIPKEPYDKIIAKITKYKTCKKNIKKLYMCECDSTSDSEFPTLSMLMGDNEKNLWFDLKPQQYLRKIDIWCEVQFRPWSSRGEFNK